MKKRISRILKGVFRKVIHEKIEEMTPHKRGIYFENVAVKFLKKNGYQVIHRNFECNFGEIDVICLKNRCISFVEVKGRTSVNYGHPSRAVGKKKRRHIIKSSRSFIISRGLKPRKISYDILSVIALPNKKLIIDFDKNAFDLKGNRNRSKIGLFYKSDLS